MATRLHRSRIVSSPLAERAFFIASLSAGADGSRASHPVTSGLTNSGTPPNLNPMAGVPQEIASMTVHGRLSAKDG